MTSSDLPDGPPHEDPDWTTDFDHLHPNWIARPDEIWRDLRERCPVAHTRRYGGVYLPTRHADIWAAAYDPETFSSRRVWIMSRPMKIAYPAPPITSDPPQHRLHRRLLLPAFAANEAERMRPAAAAVCRDLAEAVAATVDPDAALHFAQPAAMGMLFLLMGVAPADRVRFAALASRIAPVGDPHPHEVAAAAAELDVYFDALLSRRQREPGGDLVSQLLALREKGIAPPKAHLIYTLRAVTAAAVETAAATIAFALAHLADHPHDRARLIAEPDLMPLAIDEFLRAGSPATSTREAVRDGRLGGCLVKKGALVILPFGAANRDPAVFSEPDRVILDRKDNRHLAFGAGIHRCVGAFHAKMLIGEALGAWLTAFPDFALDLARPMERFGGMMMGISRLPVVLPTDRAGPFGPR